MSELFLVISSRATLYPGVAGIHTYKTIEQANDKALYFSKAHNHKYLVYSTKLLATAIDKDSILELVE